MKIIIFLFLVTITISLFSFLLFKKSNEIYITNFEECTKQYPALDSYPQVCITSDGKRFVQELGNELVLSDSILIASPRPNQLIMSPIEIKGEARGNWFFEAQMYAELVNTDGEIIGSAILTADGEWMTEEFVSFSGLLTFDAKKALAGELIIKSANPSGLVEQSKELIIPVKFR